MEKTKKYVYYIVLGFIALAISFYAGRIYSVNINSMCKVRIVFYCIFTSLLASFLTIKNEKLGKYDNKFCWIISFVFSQFIAIGSSIYLTHKFFLTFDNILHISVWIGKSIVWTLLCYPIIKYCNCWLETYKFKDNIKNIPYKRILLIALIVRIICLGAFYPCIFDFDSGFGLRTMLNSNEVQTNHHPFFVQILHYVFYKLGEFLGSPSFGFAILSCVCITFSLYVISYVTKAIQLATNNTSITKIIGYIFSIYPLFAVLSVYCTKDGLFTYSFLLYIGCLIRTYATKGDVFKNKRFLFVFSVSILLMCLTRHQGIYIVALQFVILLFLYRNYISKVIVVNIIPISVVLIFNSIILPTMDVEQTNKKESYNMFFQQTARYIKEYPNELTNKEYKAINTILDIDSIIESYQYNITDDVKSHYKYSEGTDSISDGLLHFRHVNHNGENEALKEYRKAWCTMFFRHPSAYFDATLCVVSGFFYNSGLCIIYFDTNWINSKATTPEYGFYQFTGTSKILSQINGYLSNLPLTDLLFGLHFYNWVCIFLILILIRRKDIKGIVTFFPVIFSVGILLICPVASGRYEYPIIISLPLLFAYILKTNKNNAPL